MTDVIDKTYLPFTGDGLRPHFIADVDGQLDYYQKSASRYHEFMADHPETVGIPITQARTPRQIEKDERFWTITATKHVFDDPLRASMLVQLLVKAYGSIPPISGLSSWAECLDGDLRLYFEACLPPPPSYVEWLQSNLDRRQMIPYVLDAATRGNARPLEGATHVDAMFLNVTNGFAWLIEAKVLSDVSYSISFDNFRNQIARNIDVMLDNTSQPGAGLERRNPERSLFGLLTPAQFKDLPHTRLYGWLMPEYSSKPEALARDLSHRTEVDWPLVSRRIGWLTFEDFEEARHGACPWVRRREDGAT
ncbi:MAG: hypothetical protein JRD93_18585 [Deltaproteobacteria bacterium]|nr:hypothetical protein [Deltaproteobacteria bacterium]